MTIMLDRICADPTMGPVMKQAPSSLVPMRVHHDVVHLAEELVVRDSEKLKASAKHLFMPAEDSWFEWPMGPEGDMAIMFLGGPGNVQKGDGVFYAWRHRGEDDGPTSIPLSFDLEKGIVQVNMALLNYANSRSAKPIQADPIAINARLEQLKPVIFAFLALINSPKIVRRDPARVDKLNKRRQAAGRYTFHPHHVIRLNVDKKTMRVGSSAGGDGATRALHFVRAHLRLWNGQYILVQPHWRGDPQVGILKPNYEVDRQTSRWRD